MLIDRKWITDEFADKVEFEMAHARDRCLQLLTDAGGLAKERKKAKLCTACGCDLNDLTPGCSNCSSRHSMRRLSIKRGATPRARTRIRARTRA